MNLDLDRQFSGKSIESDYQNFHAKVSAKNLTTIVSSTTSKDIQAAYRIRKYLYHINHAQAYAEMKRMILLFFSLTIPAQLKHRLIQ